MFCEDELDLNNELTAQQSDDFYLGIDHIAIAVRDLDEAIAFYTQKLRFTLIRRLEIKGSRTGMISAEIQSGEIKLVLCQGTDPDSQVSKLVRDYGPGVAHVALSVRNATDAVTSLSNAGMTFDTSVIGGPNLRQAFSSRDINSGMAFEIIERNGEEGFLEANINELFDQLEASDSY